jgi:hypothetical protein
MKLNSIPQSWQLPLKRSRVFVAALLIPLSLTQCASAFERVVDQNGKPLEGVVIIKAWAGDNWNPIISQRGCIGAAMGVTNKDGIFPRLTNPRWWRGGEEDGFTIFKRGYKLRTGKYPDLSGGGRLEVNNVYTMEPNDDAYDKIEYKTNAYPQGCSSNPLSKKDGLCDYRRGVAEDSIRLAKTSQQKHEAGGAMIGAIECETGKEFSIEQRRSFLDKNKLW